MFPRRFLKSEFNIFIEVERAVVLWTTSGGPLSMMLSGNFSLIACGMGFERGMEWSGVEAE